MHKSFYFSHNSDQFKNTFNIRNTKLREIECMPKTFIASMLHKGSLKTHERQKTTSGQLTDRLEKMKGSSTKPNI